MHSRNKKAAYTIFAAGILATMVVAGTVAADGPIFNIFPIAYDGSLNTDYPLLDARNVTDNEGWSTSQADHHAGVSADPGEVIEFLVYYHNGAPDAAANVANNVNLRVNVPGNLGKNFTTSATLSASNASSISSANHGGDVPVNISGSENQTLSLIPGSTVWLPNRATSSQVMPDSITGSGISLGDIRGCWQYAGFVKFRVRVSQNQATYSLAITKQVRAAGVGSFSASVAASPGDSVEFQLVGRNTGTGSIAHFIFSDSLPAKMTFVPGTLNVSQTPLSGNLFTGGLDVGQVNPGVNVTLTFRAQLDAADAFPVGTTTLTNGVTLSGSGPMVGSQSASAQVSVTVAAPQTCTVRVQATLDGVLWYGNLSHNISGPSPITGTALPNDYFNRALGTYTAGAPSGGGPANSTFISVTPSSGNCPANGTLTFTYQYSLNQTQDFSITKQVRNITTGGSGFAASVNAQPSQTVEFKIEVTNLGNTTLYNFNFRDVLPNRLTYMPNTLTLNGAVFDQAYNVFASWGINVGYVLAGEKKTFLFRAQLAGQNEFGVGQTVLTNTAYAVFTGLAEKSASAQVVVNKEAPVKENGNPSARPQ